MLRDSRLKNSEMEEEIENVPSNPNVPKQFTNTKPKIERTPVKSRVVNPPSFLLRTPERQAKNRFGFSSLNECRSEIGSYLEQSSRNHSVSLNLTPRVSGRNNGTNSTSTSTNTNANTYSEVNSVQTTPTKSVSKPPHPGYLYSNTRHPANGSARSSAYSRGGAQPCVVVNTVDVSHFDLKEDPSFWMDHNVQVIIRVRPLNGNERSLYGYNRCVKQENSQSITWIGHPETRFTFDHVACETVDQEMLFRMAGLPMVENCLSGYNSCMFAYGQTGSGKTYTMLGEMEDIEFTPSPHRGMTPRIFEFLFARMRAEEESRRDEKLKYSCKCSFLEIYNEQITDLLDPSSTNLLLREDVKKGVYVENLSEFEVHTVGDVLGLLIQGSSNRKVAATNMNRESSRSHCVFICTIESKWERDLVVNYRFARLNLVDLAGSERQKSSGAEGERLKEAANINKSLSTLGHVIMLLVDIAHGKPRHIPYRDSRLTFLLQDSLGGNSKTMIIANVSPSVCCSAETLNTLKFAQRAKLIQNNAVVNEDSSGDVAVLQHQIWLLKEELSTLKHQNISRTLAFDPATSIRNEENCDKDTNSETDQLNAEDLSESEAKRGVRVTSKQLKSLEMMLAGAMRREQMAETSMKQFEAEIEQLNRLVRQREEDTRCTKMMLKFREDKIQRLESVLGEVKPIDTYLLEENAALSEEIQMLQAKVERNPEVTRFAVENIRLLEELRRFQDFYEEGERDLLMNEISELRAQLIRFHDSGMQQYVISNPAQDSATDGKEHVSLTSQLTNTAKELAECQTKLQSCLETNLKLNREIEELHAQFKNKDHFVDAVKDIQVQNIPCEASDRVVNEKKTKLGDWVTAEEIVNLELELDIMKIILKEEKLSRCKTEELICSLTRDAQMAEQQVFGISKELKDAEADLAEAKSVIQALESQHLLSLSEIEDLKNRNSHHLELLCKQELQISALKEQACRQESTSCLKHSESEKSPLQEQLKRMQASLDKAKRLNMWYQSDHAYQRSNEEEMDKIRTQAEAETAQVIVCMQEELIVLQERVNECDLREREAENKLLILETELNELHQSYDKMSYDNEVLNQNLQHKEAQIKLLAGDWELLSCEIEEALIEGHEALRSASHELDSASSSSTRGWISEQVGKMIRQISDKELLIEQLNNYLEEANTKTIEMEHKLMSLKGATIVMSEAHQQECYEKEKEILQLKSELHASLSAKMEEIVMSEAHQQECYEKDNETLKLKSELQATLSAKTEQISMHENNGLESVQAVEVGVVSLQAAFTDFEKQCQEKLLSLNHKLNKLDECATEAKSSWSQTKELLQYELTNSKAATAQKEVEASCLPVRCEEVQETMNEADMMINRLMAANEKMKAEIEGLRNMDLFLNGEIDRLVTEVQTLQSASDVKDQKCSYLETQLVLDASETASIVEELQGLVSAVQDASEEAVNSLTLDFSCVKSQLQDSLNLLHTSLEEIWSEVVLKECTLLVLHLCHIGTLSEMATMINFEDDLHLDLCESKTLINDLREQNMKLNQEISMYQLVKEKIFSDINSCHNHISHKESDIRKFDLKLDSLTENLVDLQCQEELMLERCIFMSSKLAVLEKELNQSNLTVAASLVEQEKLQENNAKLIESQAEMFAIKLYAKDLEITFMSSELEQLAQHNSNLDVSLMASDLKLASFKETLMDIQHHEEVMLDTCNSLDSKLAVLEEELNQNNLTVAASLEEQETNNAKLIESQAEMFAIKLYAKDLEISFMASELYQLAQQNSYIEVSFQTSDLKLASLKENLVDLQHHEELMLETCNSLGSKLGMLEEELNQSNVSVAVSLEEQEKNNTKLIESRAEVFAIELYAKDLEVSILASELQQLAQHNFDMDKQQQICCNALDSLVNKIVTLNIFADFREQLLVEKESEIDNLQTTIKTFQDSESRVFTQLQALSTLSSRVANSYSMEKTELQSCRVLNQLEQKAVLVLDKVSEDHCQNIKLVSKFLEELECVEHIAKEIVSENLSLKEMSLKKDEVLNGLLFDLRLLQESAANSKDQQDQIEKIEGLLESTECELATKSRELDEATSLSKALETKVKEHGDIISATKMELENANQSLKNLSDENEVLKSQVKDIALARSSVESELGEKLSVIDSLENELLSMGNTLGQLNDLVESLKSNLDNANSEKDHFQNELLTLEGKLETTLALAGENEAIAVEAQQIAESRRIYAEEKEEEVQLLERSVQELDSTITVLENKVDALKGEAERQRLQREELELELHSFKNQMQSVEFADSEIKRHLDEKTRSLQEASTFIKVLEKDLARRDTEVAQCRTYISELSVHAEAQACEYKQKFKELESMLEQFKAEAASNHERNASCNKLEKNPSKARGSASPFKAKGSSSPFKGRASGSPFKCIGLGHQLKSEKDEEINAERHRIEELEALANSRQKEIFMLNTKLASTESMTHDVIRDLLGVKMDMSKCADLLDKKQVKKITEIGQLDRVDSQDHQVINLKKQLDELIEEKKGWLEELDRKKELVTAQIALEKLREQELFFSTENKVLKRDLSNHKRQVVELEGEVNKLLGQQNLQQRIHHHAKIKEENNMLKLQIEELSTKVREGDAYMKRLRKGLNHYHTIQTSRRVIDR